MTEEALDAASGEYDRAEQAYIRALAAGADGEMLRSLARRVADAAGQWDAADIAAPEAPPNISRYYDLPEVLVTLCRDLAEAHERGR